MTAPPPPVPGSAGTPVTGAGGPGRDNRRGALWLLADMALNIWALSIVKLMGADFSAAQLVFLRALVGLVLLLPFLWAGRAGLRVGPWRLHLLRVGLSATALVASFHAVAQVSLALFTAIGFTRPLLLMAMVAVFLGERIRRRQVIAGLVGLFGVLLAVQPLDSGTLGGLAALVVTVLAGTAAIVVTRRLRDQQTLVLMLFYTAGLAAATAVPAALLWQPPGAHWPMLLAVGVFAQAAQACFLRAHFWGEGGVLALLGYLSLPVSAAVGFAVFSEVPTLNLLFGALLIVGSVLAAGRSRG
jgi:drug/metabolite transporter (DMT)-like permease